MPRHKDVAWRLPDGEPIPGQSGSHTHQWDSIHAAILMDIRDELKRLNSALYCPSFVAIPRTLTRIARNTAKPRKKPAPTPTRGGPRRGR